MPRNRRSGKHAIHRKPVQRRHLHAVPDPGGEPDPRASELLDGVRQALRADTPVVLLGLVSAMLEISDPRGDDPWGPAADARILREDVVRSFIETPFAETTALLTVMARMLPPGDPAREEIAAELPRRRHPLPQWLRDLADGRVETQVMRMTEDLGDGENCMLGVRFASGDAFTAVIFTDHNLGSAVKDAFLVAAPIDEVAGRILGGEFEAPGPDLIGPWDPATARATVSAAIERGRHTLGMPESDDWPASRPAIEWLLTLLPDGGVPEEPAWEDRDVEALRREFLASEEGASVDDEDAEFALDMILRFGDGYNVGGPLRWSPAVAEIFLLDWMPRKVVVRYAEVARMPTILADFVRFAHRRAGVDRELTGEVLLAIGSAAEEYALGMMSVDPYADLDDELDLEGFMADRLADAVGGVGALAALDAAPLPDEDFVWDGIADDVRGRVGEYLAMLDTVADEHLDVEHRTAMRRFLSRVAAADPAIFRRRSSVARGAAAVAWAVCRANDTVGTYRAGLAVKDLAAWFGTGGSVSQRAEPMLRAIQAPAVFFWDAIPLGSADFLVSRRRASIIEERDRRG